ncbi:RNA-directed DNA polymerase, eukaryota [Tanacetum coccineum]
MNFLSLNIQGLGNKAKKGWIQELNTKHRVNFVALQETKMEKMDLFSIKALWGNLSFDYAFSPSIGYSGGILCFWDPRLFVKDNSTVSDSFLAISDSWDGECVLLALFLDKHFSDLRHILLHELNVDYGPTPFRFFHSWSSRKGFDKMVEDSWKNSIYGDWIVEPSLVKNEFLKHFATRFAAPSSSSSFPPGCNSSFITLIPKSQEAKMVKEFCPISLIGSMYKIITKVLANRLSLVISELCKHKKSKALIFKIYFEKAFNSVRWDYLNVVLANFCFGLKWRSWIQGCLNSAMGYILVNGSPTSEFKFSKGLKQGDPLSPFLFILIMESLHLSFNNVVNAGLYNACASFVRAKTKCACCVRGFSSKSQPSISFVLLWSQSQPLKILWEWCGIANMALIQLGGSSRVVEMILARVSSGFAG